MKNSAFKPLFIACVVILSATAAVAADDMKTIMSNIREQQATVNQDLLKINQQQENLKTLGRLCRQEPRNASVHREYKEQMAALKQTKKQLRKNDAALMEAHEAHISLHKQEVMAQHKVLAKAQRQLDIDKAKGVEIALFEADEVMNARAELRKLFTDTERARLERDKDRWVINREYYDIKSKSFMVVGMNTSINIDNTAQK